MKKRIVVVLILLLAPLPASAMQRHQGNNTVSEKTAFLVDPSNIFARDEDASSSHHSETTNQDEGILSWSDIERLEEEDADFWEQLHFDELNEQEDLNRELDYLEEDDRELEDQMFQMLLAEERFYEKFPHLKKLKQQRPIKKSATAARIPEHYFYGDRADELADAYEKRNKLVLVLPSKTPHARRAKTTTDVDGIKITKSPYGPSLRQQLHTTQRSLTDTPKTAHVHRTPEKKEFTPTSRSNFFRNAGYRAAVPQVKKGKSLTPQAHQKSSHVPTSIQQQNSSSPHMALATVCLMGKLMALRK